MLDVFAMIVNYCDVLIERVELLKKNRLVFVSPLNFKFSIVSWLYGNRNLIPLRILLPIYPYMQVFVQRVS